MISILWVVLTLALVVVLAFKKVNIVAISVLAAAVLALLDGQNLMTALTDTFMTSAANYVKNFLLLFAISALFGKLMEVTRRQLCASIHINCSLTSRSQKGTQFSLRKTPLSSKAGHSGGTNSNSLQNI